MDERQFKVGDLVRHRASGERAIVTVIEDWLATGKPNGCYTISSAFAGDIDHVPGILLEKVPTEDSTSTTVSWLRDKPDIIYLAAPYSSQSCITEHNRFYSVSAVAAKLIKEGHVVISPITHSHPMRKFWELKGDYKTWRKQNELFMDMSTRMIILKLDGWEESEGIREEKAYMEKQGKPIEYMGP